MNRRFTYFNTRPVNPITVGSSTSDSQLGAINSAHVGRCNSWTEFNRQCAEGKAPTALICGASQVFETSPQDFLATVHSIIKTHDPHRQFSVGVSSSDELEYDDIEKLKNAGFSGIHAISAYYGIDAAAESMGAFLNFKPNWKDFVINDYKKVKETPTIVIFNNRIKDQLNLSSFKFYAKQRRDFKFKLEIVGNWEDLVLKIKRKPSAIVFHANMIDDSPKEFISTLESLIKFTYPRGKITLGVTIEKDTQYSIIEELRQTKVSGIIPTFNDYGERECLAGIESLLNTIPYWPKHILNNLPNHKNKVKKQEVELTYRQQQILNLIQTRGITNQQIAETLKIKEGTVKLHVGLLLKKYSVRNRTQLANL